MRSLYRTLSPPERSALVESPWYPYLFAAVAMAATVALRFGLSPWLGDRPSVALFVVPIALSVYVGGSWPGLACTALAMAAGAYFVLPPKYSFAIADSTDVAQLLVLGVAGVVLSVLNYERSRARRDEPAPAQSYTTAVRRVRGGFTLALGWLVALSSVSYFSLTRLDESAAMVAHTHEVLRQLERLSWSANRSDAASTAVADFRQLHALTADNPEQQRRVEQLAPLVDALPLAGDDGRRRERMRSLIEDITVTERSLLDERADEVRRSSLVARAIIVGGGVMAFAFVGWALFAVRRDLGARLRAEAELERFFSLSLDFLCIASADGYFKRVSPAVTGVLGWNVDEFLGRPYMDFVHPDDHDATLREVARQIKGGESVLRFDNRYRHKDGSWRVLSWRSIPHGELMYATARDVTEIRNSERELREAKENLQASVQERTSELQEQLARLALLSRITRAIGERQDIGSVFQVVLATLEEQLPVDFACLCTYSRSADTFTVAHVGARSSALAVDLQLLTPPALFAAAASGLAPCTRGEVMCEAEIASLPASFMQRLSGAELKSLMAAPLVGEDGVFGVLVTARRRADGFTHGECEFLRQLCEHVALAANQARLYGALQTAYDDLRQSQQAVMQQERLRVLGQMASGIAHDINNALSPVTVYASLLERERNLGAPARGYLHTIRQAVNDVAGTVARMREFYRQSDPQQAFEPLQLNATVPQIVALTRARWADMPQQQGIVIRMHTDLASDLPVVMGTESEIREALTNLVLNAVDAMPEGGTLTLRTATQPPPAAAAPNAGTKRVCIEVADSGIGMDEETRRRCLEPFFTTKGERGTGLGLAMVYGIVRRHGGEIEIDSAPGAGTTVRLSLPAAVGTAVAPDTAAVQSPLEPLRILVVDDDPIVLTSLHDLLVADRHNVTVADQGQKAVQLFASAGAEGVAFDVVITDLGMPYLDGRQVAAAIKAACPAMPVILLTGWGQRLIAEQEALPHIDRVLSKPPNVVELRAALAALVRKSAANR